MSVEKDNARRIAEFMVEEAKNGRCVFLDLQDNLRIPCLQYVRVIVKNLTEKSDTGSVVQVDGIFNPSDREVDYIYSTVVVPELGRIRPDEDIKKAKEAELRKPVKSIAEQIAEKTVIDDTEEIEKKLGHKLSDNPMYDYVEAGII